MKDNKQREFYNNKYQPDFVKDEKAFLITINGEGYWSKYTWMEKTNGNQ